MNSVFLEIQNLKKSFPLGMLKKNTSLKAVDGVSFCIEKNQTVSLVGESGCGKTTLGRLIVRLLKPDSGTVRWKNQDLSLLSEKQFFPIRKEIQMIFQDPFTSLNPRWTLQKILTEGVNNFKKTSPSELSACAAHWVKQMGLPKNSENHYPHEFSGGQRQRIAIARALALSPELIICDEIFSALDVSIRAQILNQLLDLKQKLSLSFLFISHHLKLSAMVSDQLFVMYLGKIVEKIPGKNLFENARHPYTQSLLASLPESKTPRTKLSEPASPADIPSGCRFHPRCPWVTERCKHEEPLPKKIGPEHEVSCHLI
jgi:oligopeptide/dipeptide ABC transporter ATP-binding protein